ncbi:MAG: hypothetical protein IJS94_05170, partial [Clostridia bacterium]|nr:hypothetical protein [Clostridia bacterium]
MRKKSTVSVLRTVCLILCAAFILVTLSGCSDIFNSLSLDDVSSIFNGDDFSGWFDNDGNTGND